MYSILIIMFYYVIDYINIYWVNELSSCNRKLYHKLQILALRKILSVDINLSTLIAR